MTRSALLPLLVKSRPFTEQIYSRVANLYNDILGGHNKKMLMLSRSNCDLNHTGFMASNIKLISKRWHCGYERLVNNHVVCVDKEMAARAEALFELIQCREKQAVLSGFTIDELNGFIKDIACY